MSRLEQHEKAGVIPDCSKPEQHGCYLNLSLLQCVLTTPGYATKHLSTSCSMPHSKVGIKLKTKSTWVDLCRAAIPS